MGIVTGGVRDDTVHPFNRIGDISMDDLRVASPYPFVRNRYSQLYGQVIGVAPAPSDIITIRWRDREGNWYTDRNRHHTTRHFEILPHDVGMRGLFPEDYGWWANVKRWWNYHIGRWWT